MTNNRAIKVLKRKLSNNEKNKKYLKMNNETETKEMHSIYNTENYNKSYIRTSVKLFQDYKDYISKKITLNKKEEKKKRIKDYNDYLNDMNNVRNFLLYQRGLNDSTYKNRYNPLRRTLFKINGNINNLSNDLKIIESVNKEDKVFLNQKEKEEFLKELYKEKELELILIHYFTFIFGLNISEVAKIKVNNLHNDCTNVKLFIDLKIIKRTIEKSFSKVIKFYINLNCLLTSDYLIYTSIKNTKVLSRTSFFEKRYISFIDSIESLSVESKSKMLSQLH